MINGPALAVILVLAAGYYTVEAVKKPVKKAGHAICHVVTFGKKCDNDKPPMPTAGPPCPPGYVFLEGESLHGCFNDKPQP